MKWRGGRRSTNVEDRRGSSVGRGVKMGGGIGGLGIVAVIVMFLLGGDPMQLLGQLLGGGAVQQQAPAQRTQTSAESDALAEFASVVLADTETTWQALFKQYGSQYREPKLVLFEQAVDSACGRNSSATGPFYCPGDYKLYLDTSFFAQLAKMGAPGDFASAYVIGHEVAHHVQNITGVLTKVRALQGRSSKVQQNALQVLVELQADCYAGVWANHAETRRDMLDEGDVEEGMRAAASIGDDTLQRNARQRVRPETFTHGTSEQRQRWFRAGISSGDVAACDTFADAGVRL